MTRGDFDTNAGSADRVREGWAMLSTNRPHAAWAIWQSVVRVSPDHRAASEALATLAEAQELPDVARKPLRFLTAADEASRKRWDEKFRRAGDNPAISATAAEPAEAAAMFRELAEAEPGDAPAHWNLAVCLAWCGANRSAVETLGLFVKLVAESQPDLAADAWTLAELLRHGAGAEELADDLNLSLEVPRKFLADGISAEDLSKAFGRIVRYAQAPEGEEAGNAGIVAGDILKRPVRANDESAVNVLASVVISSTVAKIGAPAAPEAGLLFRELCDQWQFLRPDDRYPQISNSVFPIRMLDAAVARFRIPPDLPESKRDALAKKGVAEYFEHQWIHQPRVGLDNRTPWAVSRERSPAGRARLEGLIQFQEQLARRAASRPLYQDYEFDRLRYRLGLFTLPGKDDVKGEARHKALSLYNRDHVAQLDPGKLTDDDLVTAWESAAACRDDDSAIRLGEELRRRDSGALSQVPLSRWIAPFLRKFHAGNRTTEALELLNFAISKDIADKGGRDEAELLVWSAQLRSRNDDPAAVNAWKAACAHPDAPPIRLYEAVVDLWEMDASLAREFAREALTMTDNSYVRALLRACLDQQSD